MVTTLNANADPGDYPPADYKIEPYKFTAREIRKLISLIRKNSCETDIDKHLRSNLSLLAFASKFFHSGHHGTWVIPQATIKPPSFSNGPGKIPDYLFAGDNSDGVTWWVVELKSPRHRLFTSCSGCRPTRPSWHRRCGWQCSIATLVSWRMGSGRWSGRAASSCPAGRCSGPERRGC
jgi:hypothetical protein